MRSRRRSSSSGIIPAGMWWESRSSSTMRSESTPPTRTSATRVRKIMPRKNVVTISVAVTWVCSEVMPSARAARDIACLMRNELDPACSIIMPSRMIALDFSIRCTGSSEISPVGEESPGVSGAVGLSGV